MGKRLLKQIINIMQVRYFVFIIILYITFNIIIHFLFSNNITLNKAVLNTISPDTKYNLIHTPKINNIINKMFNMVSNISINNPTTLLDNGLMSLVDVSYVNSDIISSIAYEDDYSNMNELEKSNPYIVDPNPKEIVNPRVYIFNSHQLENYSMKNMEPHNIRPNVMMASYIMREHLNKLGLPTIVDETNLTEFLRINSWTHADSYKASRIPLLDAINKYETLEFFIDIHRDSPRRDITTVTIDDKLYARVMFVVGLENPKYKYNLKLAQDLNAMINEKYPKLSRGILTKKGKGVNGLYNQDVSPNMILLEIGGIGNTIDEVANTTEIMAQIIYKYIQGE